MRDAVQLVRRHAGRDVPGRLLHRPRRDPAGDPHPFDGVGVLDLWPGVRVGAGFPTYSGRGMAAGTPRAGRSSRGKE
ncbi:hypothetical protein NKH77_15270 [Streptomyces sp. M19]